MPEGEVGLDRLHVLVTAEVELVLEETGVDAVVLDEGGTNHLVRTHAAKRSMRSNLSRRSASPNGMELLARRPTGRRRGWWRSGPMPNVRSDRFRVASIANPVAHVRRP